MVKLSQTYGLSTPIQNSYPLPIVSPRSPTTSDLGKLPGQIWINTTISDIYMLVQVAAGAAEWKVITS